MRRLIRAFIDRRCDNYQNTVCWSIFLAANYDFGDFKRSSEFVTVPWHYRAGEFMILWILCLRATEGSAGSGIGLKRLKSRDHG